MDGDSGAPGGGGGAGRGRGGGRGPPGGGGGARVGAQHAGADLHEADDGGVHARERHLPRDEHPEAMTRGLDLLLAFLLGAALAGAGGGGGGAPRAPGSALPTLLMWTKAEPTGPTEVTAADPLPVTISGDATLDTLTIDEKILLPAGTPAAPGLQWPATGGAPAPT